MSAARADAPRPEPRRARGGARWAVVVGLSALAAVAGACDALSLADENPAGSLEIPTTSLARRAAPRCAVTSEAEHLRQIALHLEAIHPDEQEDFVDQVREMFAASTCADTEAAIGRLVQWPTQAWRALFADHAAVWRRYPGRVAPVDLTTLSDRQRAFLATLWGQGVDTTAVDACLEAVRQTPEARLDDVQAIAGELVALVREHDVTTSTTGPLWVAVVAAADVDALLADLRLCFVPKSSGRSPAVDVGPLALGIRPVSAWIGLFAPAPSADLRRRVLTASVEAARPELARGIDALPWEVLAAARPEDLTRLLAALFKLAASPSVEGTWTEIYRHLSGAAAARPEVIEALADTFDLQPGLLSPPGRLARALAALGDLTPDGRAEVVRAGRRSWPARAALAEEPRESWLTLARWAAAFSVDTHLCEATYLACGMAGEPEKRRAFLAEQDPVAASLRERGLVELSAIARHWRAGPEERQAAANKVAAGAEARRRAKGQGRRQTPGSARGGGGAGPDFARWAEETFTAGLDDFLKTLFGEGGPSPFGSRSGFGSHAGPRPRPGPGPRAGPGAGSRGQGAPRAGSGASHTDPAAAPPYRPTCRRLPTRQEWASMADASVPEMTRLGVLRGIDLEGMLQWAQASPETLVDALWPGATQKEVRRALRSMQTTVHPDKFSARWPQSVGLPEAEVARLRARLEMLTQICNELVGGLRRL